MTRNPFKRIRPRKLSRRSSLHRNFRPLLEQLEPRQLLSTNVLTFHNDLARTGQNLTETILTPDNVNATTFGKLFSYAVDGQVYAQPLYMANVTIGDGSTHNIVFVATEHDSVYAFDADDGITYPDALWKVSFIDPGSGITTVPSSDVSCDQIAPELGITATPVIDPGSGTLYVVAQTKEGTDSPRFVQRLHALDIGTGREKFGGPVEIQAEVPGTGDGGSTVPFIPRNYKERPGLVLLNGVVYTSWSSHCDITPAHGWVISYNAQTLQQVSVYNTSPNGQLDTIWQAGGAPAADRDGNLYFETGNGSHDIRNGNYSEAFLKLSTSGGLSVADYFSPFNWQTLDDLDEDLGSGAPIVLPDQLGAHRHLLVGAGKEGKIYLIDRDNLGQENAGFDNIVQSLPNAISGGSWDVPAYFDAGAPDGPWIYYAGAGDFLKAFRLTNGLFQTSPTSQSGNRFDYPGATPIITANGTTNGIVWTLQNGGTAVLRAYDALDLNNELYDSNQAGERDQLGQGVKFAVPIVADGKAFVGTDGMLTVFGLLQGNRPGYARTAPAVDARSLVLPASQKLDREALNPIVQAQGKALPMIGRTLPPLPSLEIALGVPDDQILAVSDGHGKNSAPYNGDSLLIGQLDGVFAAINENGIIG